MALLVLSFQKLAIPAVCLLVAFLGYGSQVLFARSPDLAPGPLTSSQKYVFNTLLLCLWWTYYRACTTDPGRYEFPSSTSTAHKKKKDDSDSNSDDDDNGSRGDGDMGGIDGKRGNSRVVGRRKHCRKCALPKPRRSHHCRVCKRCVPKMDHHCPWTANCVSLQTFPHFLRFLVYTNMSLWSLLFFLAQRFYNLWLNRHLPAYLGPTLLQLVWLTVFALITGTTSLLLGMMLGTTVKGWLFNTTMIEGWEVDRHEAVLERMETDEGFWRREGENADVDDKLWIEPVEFPYDIGIYANMAQAMGTANPILWFLPFASSPKIAPNRDGQQRGTGWEYEENGLNDAPDMWPPPDPERLRNNRVWRSKRHELQAERESFEVSAQRWTSPEEQREAFRRRQDRDLLRWEGTRSRILGELEEIDDYDFVDDPYRGDRSTMMMTGSRNHAGWVNADGEQLRDYGVDEDADEVRRHQPLYSDKESHRYQEEEDDEEVPLAELVRRRKVRTKDGQDT